MKAAATAASQSAASNHRILEALAAAGLERKSADLAERLAGVTPEQARREIAAPAGFSLSRLAALISPAASGFLEDMAQAAYRLTRRRFGNAVSLFAPLYVSNYCVNHCRYCGFNCGRPHRRKRLSVDEALAEARIIASEGFTDLLLVSGEDRQFVDIPYLCELARLMRRDRLFSTIGIESYTVTEEEYRQLFAAGVDGVTIFQETYERDAYVSWHPGGPKADCAARIDASEAAAAAGMRRIGLGVLLGLEDWRFDTLAMAVHADVLTRNYWRTRVAFSFPRIRPSESGMSEFPYVISDRDFTQMILALRLCFPDAAMTLSTRETPGFRDSLIPLGITQISAGSKTNPGGYGEETPTATEQFAVSDERSAAEMAEVLRRLGFDPVWKDWDAAFVNAREEQPA